MYSLSTLELKEIEILEQNLFFSNGVVRYSKDEILKNINLSNSVLRLQYLYNKMRELYLASSN
jgi:hypothetical protein